MNLLVAEQAESEMAAAEICPDTNANTRITAERSSAIEQRLPRECTART